MTKSQQDLFNRLMNLTVSVSIARQAVKQKMSEEDWRRAMDLMRSIERQAQANYTLMLREMNHQKSKAE